MEPSGARTANNQLKVSMGLLPDQTFRKTPIPQRAGDQGSAIDTSEDTS